MPAPVDDIHRGLSVLDQQLPKLAVIGIRGAVVGRVGHLQPLEQIEGGSALCIELVEGLVKIAVHDRIDPDGVGSQGRDGLEPSQIVLAAGGEIHGRLPGQAGGYVHPADLQRFPPPVRQVLDLSAQGAEIGADRSARVQIQIEALVIDRVQQAAAQGDQDTDNDDEPSHVRPLLHPLGGVLGAVAILVQALDILIQPFRPGEQPFIRPTASS